MSELTSIYHGTPLTPREALLAVLRWRAACVSFYRPDDAEAVEAVCPLIMFRPRRFFVLATGASGRARVGRGQPHRVVGGVLRLARPAPLLARSLGDHPRQSGSAEPDQRRPAQRLAARAEGRACLAHGARPRPPRSAMRALCPSLHRLDRRPKEGAGRMRRLPRTHGRDRGVPWQCAASDPLASRHAGGSGLRVRRDRRQHGAGAKRASL